MDERFTAAFWDERYGTAERLWSGAPNTQLVAEAADLEPGTALDAGCGEGGDAHWLAARGWRVTALDVSAVALRRGAAHAPPDVADRIRWQQADFRTWEPGGEAFDLVSAQFLHFPSALRTRVYAHLAAAVAPGGTLLIVAHEPSELHTGMGHDQPRTCSSARSSSPPTSTRPHGRCSSRTPARASGGPTTTGRCRSPTRSCGRGDAERQRPCHTGGRLSRNACMPSCASHVTAFVAMISRISS